MFMLEAGTLGKRHFAFLLDTKNTCRQSTGAWVTRNAHRFASYGISGRARFCSTRFLFETICKQRACWKQVHERLVALRKKRPPDSGNCVINAHREKMKTLM